MVDMRDSRGADGPGSGRVAIVIPCYNSGRVVVEAVKSARAQTYLNLEIVVVNDGSTEKETLDALVEISAETNVSIVHQENHGLAAARNTGICATEAEYVMPLDADDLIEPPYVAEAVSILKHDDEVRMVYCRADLFGLVNRPWMLPEFSWQRILVHNQIFCTNLFRRCDWVAVGGYDERFRHGREDHDFILKLLTLGGRPYRLEGVYFHYRQSGSGMNDALGKSRELLVETSARLFRNNIELYVDHAEDLFRFIFDQHDQIMDLTYRYQILERIRRRFPRAVELFRWPVRMVRRSISRRGEGVK